jgi:tetratricopeptide (TPR) repeat protein
MPAGKLTFRVFVSSTFRDMGAERETLAKRVFPRLRKECERRGVTWGDVDLRWGVTDEEKAEGLALRLCLDEIDRCSCFIGILGDRYGWAPDGEPAEITRNRPWLAGGQGRSITEYEIRHALNRPELRGNSFFYFRGRGHNTTAERIGGAPEPLTAAEERRRLEGLKGFITSSGAKVLPEYTDAQALGDEQGLAAILSGQALLLIRAGRYEEAPRLIDRPEELSARAGSTVLMGVALGNRAIVHGKLGEWERAIELRRRQEEIGRRAGDPELVAAALLNRAMAEMERAISESPSGDEGQPEGLSAPIVAGLVKAKRLLDEAAALAEENLCVGLARNIEHYRDRLKSQVGKRHHALIARAVEEFRRGRLDEADEMLKRAEAVARATGDEEAAGISLGEQSVILMRRGDLDGALELMREEEEVCLRLGDEAGLQACLGNQAVAFIKRGDSGGALRLLERQEEICRRLRDPAGLARCLGNKAELLLQRGEIDGGLKLLREQEKLAREAGDQEGVATSLISQALVLADGINLRAAREAYDICAAKGWTGLSAYVEPLLTRLGGGAGVHEQ